MTTSTESAKIIGARVETTTPLSRRLLAEGAGTFLLVFGVAGAATFAAQFDHGAGGLNIGFLGVALALGLSVLVGSSAFGPVSGGHFNPAVSVGLAVAGRFGWVDVCWYVGAQLVGGAIASSLLVLIAAGGPNHFLASAQASGFASTGWGPLSPGGYPLASAFLIEAITTCIFVSVVLAVTGPKGNAATAPIAVGLTLTLVALIAIPVSNGSFNPARSISTAIYGGPLALSQLWMSVAAPLLGAVVAGLLRRVLASRD